MAMHTLLERKDEQGIYSVFFLSDEHAQGEPAGLYVDIAYFDGTGYNELHRGCYQEAANKVFQAYGEYPDYALRY